jgi:anti-anti-sigma factor
MSGLTVLNRYDETVVVALEDSSLLEGLADLRWRLRHLLADGGTTLVVDVSGVDRLSSQTVAALLWAKRHCRARGGRVVVRGPSRRSLDVLSRTGLSSMFVIEPPAAPAGATGSSALAGRS